MADAIIGPLVGRLQDLALSEARTLIEVNKQVRMLRDKLMWMQAFVREVDNRRRSDSDELSRVWLQQTRDAVFDAEDAVDHYQLQLDMSRYPTWSQAIMKFLATFTIQVRVRHNLSRKIKDIYSRLDQIIQNKDTYKITEMANTKTETWKASTSISDAHKKLDDLHQPPMVERQDMRKVLEDKLMYCKDDSPFVIYVVGESGIGKTTVVRDAYRWVKAKKHFEVQIMQSFAPDLSAEIIRQQIVQELTDDDKNCERKTSPSMLKDALGGKKFLLVIDGEISSTEWATIKDELKNLGAKGSRVVRITQDEPEEQNAHIKVEHLNEKETTELFLTRLIKTESAKKEEHRKCIEDYDNTGIHSITEGLPLAVVLLSGLVQTKEFPSEWKMVFDRLRSKKSKRLHNILSLSFDDLPHELKSCLLYFAALPANSTIEASTLVCMWMAEGFLRPQVGKTMEKVGYRYLNELVTRNLVNQVHVDETPASRFLAVQNKVHEFLQFEAHEASFLEVHGGDDIPTLTSARRLSLQNYTDTYAALASQLPKLRSIFSHFEQEHKSQKQSRTKKRRANYKIKNDFTSHIRRLLCGSEFLRVINLQGIEIGEKFPDEIGNAVHLQYLGITSCSLAEIPESIRRLTSLQTLDVRETNVRELPPAFWMIKTLRHVFGFVLKLPKHVGSCSTHLYTLDSIQLDNEGGWPVTLGEMIHLEYLCVWYISNGNVAAFSDALRKLENLRTLILKGHIIPSIVFDTPSLRRLKFMVLKGNLEKCFQLKNMASSFPNLIMLSLEKTDVSQDIIRKLAKMPSLVTLVLYSCSCSDKELVFHRDEFLCLKKLKIDVNGLDKIELVNGALPKLEELYIHSHHSGRPVKIITENCIKFKIITSEQNVPSEGN